ncbi:hypothetical protein O181_067041 [Austropuccinia psidii MF-1]|uniref:Reverse transcriptase Ty1/copia-type domain-containing protein n=1 Tax=Austropuccinia psidii MF-1 TaxID=1389203 RepID=A0A9Q3ES39_9BASI|nr:hypothetical protein [Austropuccinia psidii MF-1]
MFLHIHVDDGFRIGESTEIIEDFLTPSNKSCSIKMKKQPTQHLGYTLTSSNIHNVVAQVPPPFSNITMQKAIGMLNYIALHTRPNIMFTTNLLSQFSNQRTIAHWSLGKHLLRYLNGTRALGFHFTKHEYPENGLTGWADADYAISLVKRSHI